ncbi:lamin tail domain-containing protein [Chryseobacterium capnotolerans]|uniref:lamin tail domain-containing protein n=1 Tax=Chryseobacterium TaxID=59732 RepID=UPI0009ECD9BF|nr:MULTISPECIES: lamin tail domain-containing protein [Chryseobacterium]UHO38673.1 lamin tail domain-containing protein [Chryseobacterium capnotolerans]
MSNRVILLISFLFAVTMSGQIMITEVYYNTPANERPKFGQGTVDAKRHHRGEFIEIYNYSDKDLNLRNWFIRDYASYAWLPDKIIKSGQLMVVAYSPMPYNMTDFPSYFTTTAGKEDQIIYQNRVMLRNLREKVELGYSFNGEDLNSYIPVESIDFNWKHDEEPAPNFIPNVWSTPDKFYTINSLQYNGTSTYSEGIPNPLEAVVKPPIKSYESMVGGYFTANYAHLDWKDNVDEVLNRICPINIERISQDPKTSSTGSSNCFIYDTAGNFIVTKDCSTSGIKDALRSGNEEYTADELDAIKKSIVIAPNPTKASDSYNVTITWSGAALNTINNIQVFNSSANTVYGFAPAEGVSTTSFNLQNQLPGAFVVNFVLHTGQIISKNVLRW